MHSSAQDKQDKQDNGDRVAAEDSRVSRHVAPPMKTSRPLSRAHRGERHEYDRSASTMANRARARRHLRTSCGRLVSTAEPNA